VLFDPVQQGGQVDLELPVQVSQGADLAADPANLFGEPSLRLSRHGRP
jgi:hypothetical protein